MKMSMPICVIGNYPRNNKMMLRVTRFSALVPCKGIDWHSQSVEHMLRQELKLRLRTEISGLPFNPIA